MEATIVYWGYIGIMEKKMEATIVYWGYIGIMDKKMEATIAYWGYIGKMEKKMETTIVYWGCIGKIEKKMETTVVYWGVYRDNGEENGNYCSIHLEGTLLGAPLQAAATSSFLPPSSKNTEQEPAMSSA